ncbi:MAG: hypothetical protein GY722_25095 [bacterium]|nr:hypothetical protein [bacterium]
MATGASPAKASGSLSASQEDAFSDLGRVEPCQPRLFSYDQDHDWVVEIALEVEGDPGEADLVGGEDLGGKVLAPHRVAGRERLSLPPDNTLRGAMEHLAVDRFEGQTEGATRQRSARQSWTHNRSQYREADPPGQRDRTGSRTKRRTPWKTFLQAHWEGLAATDLFTVEVLTFSGLRRYFVLFAIELKTRRVKIAAIHPRPHGEWMVQTARSLTTRRWRGRPHHQRCPKPRSKGGNASEDY